LNAEIGVGLSGVDLAESLDLHVAVLGLPLIVLLEQHHADLTCDRCLVGEYPVATLIPIIERKVVPDSIVYSDCWRGYNVLDVSGFHHFRINHSQLFADRHNHINGIENFWNQAKRNMRKFNGVPKEHFALFLKECEWRFNNSDPSGQLSQLRQWVKERLN
jgi:transposase-like protein